MNRQEFMRQLECLLAGIPEQERQAALQYYNDYFDDAGSENEASVIAALGNPARVAENIKRDLNGNTYGDGYERKAVEPGKEIVKYGETLQTEERIRDTSEGSQTGGSSQGFDSGESGHPAKKAAGKKGSELPAWAIVLIVILCVFGSPVILGLGCGGIGIVIGLVCILLGLLCGWFGLIFGFGVAAAACLIFGVGMIIIGGIGFGINPLSGLGVMGVGLLVLAAGVIFLMLTVGMAGWATPGIFKGIGRLWRKLRSSVGKDRAKQRT